MTTIFQHARRLITGSEAERLALDLAAYQAGVFFLQNTGSLFYSDGSAWYSLATEGNPVTGLTFEIQEGFDPGSNTPPADHWLLVALEEGLYLVDDLGNMQGPLVSSGFNLTPSGGGGKNIFVDVVNGVMRFRPLVAGDNIDLIQYTDRVEISANLLDTPISGTNLGTGGGATLYIDTIAASLRFNGVKGVEGLVATNNTVDHEIEVGLDLPSASTASEALDPDNDFTVVYNLSASEHQTATIKEVFDPQYYYGYENEVMGSPIDVEMTDADTWYPVIKALTLWEEGFIAGDYTTGGGGYVTPPNRPFAQIVHVNIQGTWAAGTDLAIVVGSGLTETSLKTSVAAGYRSVSLRGILVTNDSDDIIAVVVRNTSASEHLYITHMDLTLEGLRAVESFMP